MIESTCAKCGKVVGIYPSGQKLMSDFTNVQVVCHICYPGPAPLAPGALAEPFQSYNK